VSFRYVLAAGVALFVSHTDIRAEKTVCPIRGYAFIDAALKAGKSVDVKISSGKGDCSFLSPALLASPAKGSSGVTCKGTLFTRATLAQDWQLEDVLFTDTSASIVKPIAGYGNQLEIAFSFRVTGTQAKTLSIDTITLSTTTQQCDDWKTAL